MTINVDRPCGFRRMEGMDDSFDDVISGMWRAIGAGDELDQFDGLTTTGPRAVLPAAFDVTGLATGRSQVQARVRAAWRSH